MVSAEAAADSSTKGYETLAKAKRTVAQTSTDIYVQTAIMVGRHLCGKPQDADFGKDKAENLADIAARMRTLVGEAFPSSGNDECLATIVLPKITLPSIRPKESGPSTAKCPPPAVPNSKASAGSSAGASAGSSVPAMPTMSTINKQGDRVGAIDRLNRSGMEVGVKVSHRNLKGVYEIKAIDVAVGGGATVKLSLLFKCISMDQLWATLPARGDRGLCPGPPVQSKDAAVDEEKPAAEAPPTAGVELAASTAVGDEDQCPLTELIDALCSKACPNAPPASLAPLAPGVIGTTCVPKAGAGKPPPSLAPLAPGVIGTICGGALAGAKSGTSTEAGPRKRPRRLAALKPGMLDTICGGASAGAESGTPTDGSDEQPKSVVEFEPTIVVDLENLLKEWSGELRTQLVEYAFNAEWPAGRLAANEKHLKNLASACVFQAMAILGCKIDQGISPGSVLRQLVKPTVGFYVSAGEPALGTNRQR